MATEGCSPFLSCPVGDWSCDSSYLRDVVDAEQWRQMVSVSEGDLIRCSLQCDLCPQEETVPQRVPVQTKIKHSGPV